MTRSQSSALSRARSSAWRTRGSSSGGFLVLSVLLPVYLHYFRVSSLVPGWADLGWLLILSWLCTVLAFNLSMSALRRISAFTVNLSYNLEPVYGILLAFLIFREDKYLNAGFYIGFMLILLSITLQMLRLRRKRLRGVPDGPSAHRPQPTEAKANHSI